MSRLTLALLALGLGAAASAREYTALLGTYTGSGAADSHGIYVVKLDGETGALSTPELVAELSNPEFLAFGPGQRTLYALTRVPNADGRPTAGAVAAFALDTTAGVKLTPLNTEPTGRGQLCHIAVDATGKQVMVAAYGDPYVASFPLGADGRVGKVASVLIHDGPLGPKEDRQDKPHAHSVTLSPDNRLAFVADLGVDRVFIYGLNPADGTIAPVDPTYVPLAPGSGPRHTKFSPDGKNFYILNELGGTIITCRWDPSRPFMQTLQTVSTLPAGYTGKFSPSEVRVHPNGRFVYTANRIHNSIAVFARDAATGMLAPVEHVPTGGDQPRNFNLTPDGAWLLCAHQASDSLTVFKVDPVTGRLTATGGPTKMPKAVCVLFLD